MNDEQKEEDRKASVAAMRNAQKHMSDALVRIETLEKALSSAVSNLEKCKAYIPREVYQYNSNKRIHEAVDGFISAAREKL